MNVPSGPLLSFAAGRPPNLSRHSFPERLASARTSPCPMNNTRLQTSSHDFLLRCCQMLLKHNEERRDQRLWYQRPGVSLDLVLCWWDVKCVLMMLGWIFIIPPTVPSRTHLSHETRYKNFKLHEQNCVSYSREPAKLSCPEINHSHINSTVHFHTQHLLTVSSSIFPLFIFIYLECFLNAFNL